MRFLLRARALSPVLLSATLLTACLTTERPAVTDSARPSARVAALPSAGEWQNGDEHITFTAETRDSLTEVTEQVVFGTDGTAQRTLQLTPSGVLRRYTESRRQTAQSSSRSPTRMQVDLTLEFTGDSVTTRLKRVDGVEAPIRDYEIDAARKHAADLLAQFRAGSTPPMRP